MPYNGSGTWQRNYSWVNDAAQAIPITASRMDADSNDFASGLSLAVTRDGQGVPTADIPWGGHKITNLANGTASTDAMAYGQFSGAMLSCRNKVRNGGMDIAQRGATFNTVASLAYTLDGWYTNNSGPQAVNVTQAANSNTSSEFQNVLRVTVTIANASPAAGAYMAITQPIEGYLVRDLIGNPIAIQFTVKSPKTGTHCVALRNSASDRSYVFMYNVATANTQQIVTLTLSTGLITAGTWNWTTGVGIYLSFTLMAGTSYQTTAGSWAVGNYLGTSAQVNCMDTIGNTFELTGVQLERNSVSTQFEHLDYALELVRNQRYFETGGEPYLYISGLAGVVSAYGEVRFAVSKRAAPSVSATSWQYYSSGTNTAFTPSIPATSADKFQFQGTGLTTWQGWAAAGSWTASAEL